MTGRLRRRMVMVAIAAVATAAPATAQRTPDTVLAAVRARAVAAGFDGAILIGEQDGSSRVITMGTSPLAADAVWRWASITKQLVAVLTMQEVASGRLELDAPVARYWPDWPGSNATTIRIRDLLLHNSGLRLTDDGSNDTDVVPPFFGTAAQTPTVTAAGHCAGPARAPAPAPFEYNSCDTIVLGEILARVTGRPIDLLLRERLATPLGMRNFGLYDMGPRNRSHVVATGKFLTADSLTNLGAFGASGGAYGSIEDLWRFDHALLAGRLLRTAEREQMWIGRPENGYSGFQQWIFDAPLRGCTGEQRIVERRGLIGGMEHRNILLPQTGQAVIMFSRRRPIEYGEVWEGKGLMYDVLAAVSCRR